MVCSTLQNDDFFFLVNLRHFFTLSISFISHAVNTTISFIASLQNVAEVFILLDDRLDGYDYWFFLNLGRIRCFRWLNFCFLIYKHILSLWYIHKLFNWLCFSCCLWFLLKLSLGLAMASVETFFDIWVRILFFVFGLRKDWRTRPLIRLMRSQWLLSFYFRLWLFFISQSVYLTPNQKTIFELYSFILAVRYHSLVVLSAVIFKVLPISAKLLFTLYFL